MMAIFEPDGICRRPLGKSNYLIPNVRLNLVLGEPAEIPSLDGTCRLVTLGLGHRCKISTFQRLLHGIKFGLGLVINGLISSCSKLGISDINLREMELSGDLQCVVFLQNFIR